MKKRILQLSVILMVCLLAAIAHLFNTAETVQVTEKPAPVLIACGNDPGTCPSGGGGGGGGG